MPPIMKSTFIIPVDHFQFYLEDENSQADTSEVWDEMASDRLLVVAPDLIGIGTTRYGGDTSVTIEVHDSQPNESFGIWDQVTESSINVPSGRIVISSPENDFSKAPRITVTPGTYQALVYYGNINSVSDKNAMEGKDHYRVVLWPGKSIEPSILKHRHSVDQ